MYYKKSIQGLVRPNRPKRLSMRKKANHFAFSCLARLSFQEAELVVKSLLSADRIFSSTENTTHFALHLGTMHAGCKAMTLVVKPDLRQQQKTA